jgi:hypothetical protein
MSGILRNVIAVILGLFAYGRRKPCNVTVRKFLVTPFDSGLLLLKSDKYLQSQTSWGKESSIAWPLAAIRQT